MNLNNTTLDLNKSTDARAFDDNEILHSTESTLKTLKISRMYTLRDN